MFGRGRERRFGHIISRLFDNFGRLRNQDFKKWIIAKEKILLPMYGWQKENYTLRPTVAGTGLIWKIFPKS